MILNGVIRGNVRTMTDTWFNVSKGHSDFKWGYHGYLKSYGGESYVEINGKLWRKFGGNKKRGFWKAFFEICICVVETRSGDRRSEAIIAYLSIHVICNAVHRKEKGRLSAFGEERCLLRLKYLSVCCCFQYSNFQVYLELGTY